MAEMNRRDMCTAMAAFAMLASTAAARAGSEEAGQASDGPDLAKSHVFRLADMKVSNNANGGWGRQVLHGKLPTGEFVECHETMLPAGKMPHPPHKHSNTEFVLLREGTVEYWADGVRETVNPGDVIFTSSHQPHGMKNVSDKPAIYYVVSISEQHGSTEVELKPPA